MIALGLSRDNVCDCLRVIDASKVGEGYFKKCKYVPTKAAEEVEKMALDENGPHLFVLRAPPGYGKTLLFYYLKHKFLEEGVEKEDGGRVYLMTAIVAVSDGERLVEKVIADYKSQFRQYISRARDFDPKALSSTISNLDNESFAELLYLVNARGAVFFDDVKLEHVPKVGEALRVLMGFSRGFIHVVGVAMHTASRQVDIEKALDEVGALSRFRYRQMSDEFLKFVSRPREFGTEMLVPSSSYKDQFDEFATWIFDKDRVVAEVFKALFRKFGPRAAVWFAKTYRCFKSTGGGDKILLSHKVRDALLEAARNDGLRADREKEVRGGRCDVVIEGKCVEIKVVSDSDRHIWRENYRPDVYLVVGKRHMSNAVTIDVNANLLTASLDSATSSVVEAGVGINKEAVYMEAARAIVNLARGKLYEVLQLQPRGEDPVETIVEKLCKGIGDQEPSRRDVLRSYGDYLKALAQIFKMPPPSTASDIDSLLEELEKYYSKKGKEPPIVKKGKYYVRCIKSQAKLA